MSKRRVYPRFDDHGSFKKRSTKDGVTSELFGCGDAPKMGFSDVPCRCDHFRGVILKVNSIS